MSKKRTRMRIVAWAVAVPALVAIAWTMWNAHGTAELRAAIESASERGFPVRFHEIAGYLDTRYGAVRRTENGAPLLQAAYLLLEDVVPPDLEEPIPAVTDELRAFVREAEPALGLIAQGLERTRCRYHADWADEVAVRFPEIMGGANAANTLRAVAAIQLSEGNHAGALDQARLLSGLAGTYEEHPTLIAQMIRIAVTRMSIEVLRATLPLIDEPLATWQSAAPSSVHDSIVTGLVGEMSFLSSGLSVPGGAGAFYGLDEPDLLEKLRARVTWPSKRAAGARLVEAYLDVIADGGEPYSERLARVRKGSERLTLGIRLEPMITQEAEAVSLATVTEAGARILAFRRLHGRWPAQLDEVPGIPTDPRTGKPLEMRIEGDGLVIEAPGGVGTWRLE